MSHKVKIADGEAEAGALVWAFDGHLLLLAHTIAAVVKSPGTIEQPLILTDGGSLLVPQHTWLDRAVALETQLEIIHQDESYYLTWVQRLRAQAEVLTSQAEKA